MQDMLVAIWIVIGSIWLILFAVKIAMIATDFIQDKVMEAKWRKKKR